MAKKLTVPAKQFTQEELHGLLRHLPVRTLKKLAVHHEIPVPDGDYALTLSSHKKIFTIVIFEIGFILK